MKDAQRVVTKFIEFVLVLLSMHCEVCDAFLYLIHKALQPIIKLDLKCKADSLTCIAKYTYWTGTITGIFETKTR